MSDSRQEESRNEKEMSRGRGGTSGARARGTPVGNARGLGAGRTACQPCMWLLAPSVSNSTPPPPLLPTHTQARAGLPKDTRLSVLCLFVGITLLPSVALHTWIPPPRIPFFLISLRASASPFPAHWMSPLRKGSSETRLHLGQTSSPDPPPRTAL